MIKGIWLLLVLFAFSAMAYGQAVYTPEKGSPERKAMLDVLRVPVERDLKQKVTFVADDFKVAGNWAFIGGRPQAADGGALDHRGTRYQGARDDGAFDDNVFALLKKTSGKWRVVIYAIGCTDVCYLDWPSRYKAPKSIMPYSE